MIPSSWTHLFQAVLSRWHCERVRKHCGAEERIAVREQQLRDICETLSILLIERWWSGLRDGRIACDKGWHDDDACYVGNRAGLAQAVLKHDITMHARVNVDTSILDTRVPIETRTAARGNARLRHHVHAWFKRQARAQFHEARPRTVPQTYTLTTV